MKRIMVLREHLERLVNWDCLEMTKYSTFLTFPDVT